MVVVLSPAAGVSLRDNREKPAENAFFCLVGGEAYGNRKGGQNPAQIGQVGAKPCLFRLPSRLSCSLLSALRSLLPSPACRTRQDGRGAGGEGLRCPGKSTPSTLEYGENRQSVYVDSSVRPAIAAQELCPIRFALQEVDQGKPAEALACYRRALELKPDYAEAHHNLGLALKDHGKLDEAVACYRRAWR